MKASASLSVLVDHIQVLCPTFLYARELSFHVYSASYMGWVNRKDQASIIIIGHFALK